MHLIIYNIISAVSLRLLRLAAKPQPIAAEPRLDGGDRQTNGTPTRAAKPQPSGEAACNNNVAFSGDFPTL